MDHIDFAELGEMKFEIIEIIIDCIHVFIVFFSISRYDVL